MDFQELLNVANYNSNAAKYESSIKTYSTVLPPPKKPDKSSVQSESIRKFLAKKKAEEEARAAEARKMKEKLLELRSQSTKNNKKAKIMASRTKDNDFSKIKLSEDEIMSKKKIELELQHKHLLDKKERMKARIELNEKEKLLPRKRKRKSKHVEGENGMQERDEEQYEEETSNFRNKEKNHFTKNGIHKPAKTPPALSFNELLKVAEKKMHEPVVIPKKKEEERLMTKKEKRMFEEEQERLRRKQERLERGIEPSLSHKTPITKKGSSGSTKKSIVVQEEKNKDLNEASKFKIPKSSSVNSSEKTKISGSNLPKLKQAVSAQMNEVSDKQQIKSENKTFSKKPSGIEPSYQKKLNAKIKPVNPPSKPTEVPVIDTEALTADIERKVRERLEKQYAANLEKQIAADIEKRLQAKLEKEMEEKYRISLQEERKKLNLVEVPNKVKKPDVGKNSLHNLGTNKLQSKKFPEKSVSSKKISVNEKIVAPKLPPKKPFHKNPYLDPPRRLLKPLLPPKKRRIIDDDDEDDEDDDMSDFIDDGPSVEDENYSECIKEIFGYDRSKYIDEDDDDIRESSFAEQMKEEMQSTKLGYLEDLEEERKQKKEEMERKKKKMKMKK